MPSFFIRGCLQKGCKQWNKLEYVTYGAIFGHYYRKGREVLIKLAKETGVSQIPYSEPTFILCDKLVKISKINREAIT